MDVDPSDIPLPPILDPLLDYLADALPDPAYSLLIRFLSHVLALVTGAISLASSLISSKPWEWDAQTIIPPLITFLAAYFALLSLYRTTSWMVRTVFWFLKWGSIFGFLVGFAGYIAGNQGGNDLGLGGSGLFGVVGGLLAEILNLPDTQRGGRAGNRNGGSGVGGNYAPRQSTRQTRSKTKAQRERKSRPKPWESFDEHRDWQYRENAAADGQGDAAQQIISDIAGAATKVLLDGGWWDTAKGLFTGGNSNGDADSDTQERGSTNSRSR